MSEGETLGSFQTWLTAATGWEHQGLVALFFNRTEMVSKVEGLVGGGIGGERRREKEERGERRRGN